MSTRVETPTAAAAAPPPTAEPPAGASPPVETTADADGAAPSAEGRRPWLLGSDPGARTLRRFGQVCEALVVLCLTFIAFGVYVILSYGVLDLVWWLSLVFLVVLAALTVLFFHLAVKFNHRARLTSQRSKEKATVDYARSPYEVTPQRIATLKEKGAPRDVLRCLHEIMRATGEAKLTFAGEKEFVKELNTRLGPERTREWVKLILRYTRSVG